MGRSFTVIFLFQAEDGIRDLVRSRGLGDVYKRQVILSNAYQVELTFVALLSLINSTPLTVATCSILLSLIHI